MTCRGSCRRRETVGAVLTRISRAAASHGSQSRRCPLLDDVVDRSRHDVPVASTLPDTHVSSFASLWGIETN